MATRLLFVPTKKSTEWVEQHEVGFTWFAGYSISQKQKSVRSLLENVKEQFDNIDVLEVSTKSNNEEGIRASAFNLKFRSEVFPSLSPTILSSSVERVYQGSKVFERGGPFLEIYNNNDRRFKSDSRLKENGDLKYFSFKGEERWEIGEPFYHWLYLNALIQNPEVCEGLAKFEAFTDIEFNHKKAYNCQAHSVALYFSIKDTVDVPEILKSKHEFINVIKGNPSTVRTSPEVKTDIVQGYFDV